MEMDSRRSIGVNKKPRLVEDTTGFDRSSLNGVIDRGNRSFSSSSTTRPSPSGAGLPIGGIVPSRYNKINERDRDVEKNDSVPVPVRGGGGGVQSMQQPQQQKSQQQNQELVSQYKTALAELTFNSKPIITNLTIIAGENLHVAKWIAATICANIIEVPAEQKLPSLYLLDSIVKNIGRDYIKYFATKLPEVFCKAYRQVDTAVHSGMRHLFGTWKGVFPPDCLQMIEKDLGFPPAINGSSSSTIASRSESQSQRPPQSIHVNPKYLEARQRFQQSNRVNEVNASDDDDSGRPDRSTTIGSKRPWSNLPIKEFKHPKRETSSDSVHEKNSVGYEDNGYSSDTSRNSDLGYVRAGERVTEQDERDKSWYGVTRNIQEATASQRTTFDTQREFTNYRTSRPVVPAPQLQQKVPTQGIAQSVSRISNKNWKNSEEEEYMWDDMRSRDPRKRAWTGHDAEKEIDTRLPQLRGEIGIASRVQGDTFTDSVSLGSRGQSTFGQQTSSPWPREPHLGDGSKLLGTTSRIAGQSEGNPSLLGSFSTGIGSSLARTGLQAHTGLSVSKPNAGLSMNTVSGGVLGQPRSQPLQAASPSVQSSMLLHPPSPSSSSIRQHQESPNSAEDDRLHPLGQNTSHHLLQTNRAHHTQQAQNSFPALSQNLIQPGLQNFQANASQNIRNPSMQPSQRQHQSPFSMQTLPETSSPPSSHIQKPSVVGNTSKIGHSGLSHSINSIADVPGQPNTSSVLATLMKSGILSNTSFSAGFPNTSLQDLGTLPLHSNSLPPLPSGRPPTQLATSSPLGTPASVLDPSPTNSLRKAAVPPLPPGPPPASSVSTSSQMSTVTDTSSNPFAFLLSSLVAKGLITAEKESTTRTVPLVPSQLHDQIPALTSISTLPATSTSPSAILATSSGNELPFPEPVSKSKPVSSQATTVVPKDLIGTEFKADIIRQYHPSVINGLFEDLPHQCDLCGLRLKLRERLDRHLEWHASRKPEHSSGVSRRWYANSGDWVLGSAKSLSDPSSTSSSMGLFEGVLKGEPVVPADETQCVCILCGEPFEDSYSYERDEWMFDGAVYLDFSTVGGEAGTVAECIVEGPIVHKNCISPNSVYDLGLMKSVKQEKNDG
ncbi:Pre-mrna cleavage complex 2 protein pcf11 [Thalictrum thalictroides]|uniref:Pre-mrna cleavage complex 2 protein pcf11 n=1 Tax=Thalictrum thalictroides TaxID=46969 RepID=A0A7J6WPN5_THATH|nr:Pre-mrna cleavage complex 2 protein pcf11 [Thalictrum thalictroides]